MSRRSNRSSRRGHSRPQTTVYRGPIGAPSHDSAFRLRVVVETDASSSTPLTRSGSLSIDARLGLGGSADIGPQRSCPGFLNVGSIPPRPSQGRSTAAFHTECISIGSICAVGDFGRPPIRFRSENGTSLSAVSTWSQVVRAWCLPAALSAPFASPTRRFNTATDRRHLALGSEAGRLDSRDCPVHRRRYLTGVLQPSWTGFALRHAGRHGKVATLIPTWQEARAGTNVR